MAYQVPYCIQSFQHGVPLYPRQTQIISGGTVITQPSATVITPGRAVVIPMVAPATVLTPGTVIAPGVVRSGGIIHSTPVVQTIQTLPGNAVVVQNPQSTVVVPKYQNNSASSDLARSVGKGMAAAVQSGLVQEAAKGFVNEMERYAKSPLLDCFQVGSGIQLRSKCGGKMLHVQKDGSLDCKGELGNDYEAHFLVVAKSDNSVILRNGGNATLHLTISNGLPCTSAAATYFRLHETFDHYVTFQHQITGEYLGTDRENQLLPTQFVRPASDESKFEVILAYSPYGHSYEARH